jgi:hypothetical protein
MTPEQAASLKTCNGFGYIGVGQELPYRRDGEDYYTPSGLKAEPPKSWRPATYEQIVSEMDFRGEVPVSTFGF